MSRNFFHVRLKEVLHLIDAGNIDEAILQLQKHDFNVIHKDQHKEERLFTELIHHAATYDGLLRAAAENLSTKQPPKIASAKKGIQNAIQIAKKDIIRSAEALIKALKKEEIDSI